MEHLNNLFTPIAQIITSENFFDYHGLVLSLVWFVACLAAILARRVSPALHGVMFFILDVTTLFFTAGAWIRIYPHLATYQTWSTLKLLHILGSVFVLLLIVQHLGGVTSLLKGIHKNPVHRKFGFVVSNFARIVSVFGFLLVKKENIANYLGVATVVLLVISGYLTFFGKHDKVQVTKVEIGSAKPRRQ